MPMVPTDTWASYMSKHNAIQAKMYFLSSALQTQQAVTGTLTQFITAMCIASIFLYLSDILNNQTENPSMTQLKLWASKLKKCLFQSVNAQASILLTSNSWTKLENAQ